ncbi:MAG: SpoIIE family protein phosphatase [Clostridia bacterium]|nr:SpoIIE family protein phosphatase [Clostridia bacterium]
MDKQKTTKKASVFSSLATQFRLGAERRKNDRGALIADISVFLTAFFFARTHILFGSHPLATALVAVLPSRVFISLIGAVVGSLSLGRVGIIHAIISLIILLLRIIISSGFGEKRGEREAASLFGEPLVMRLAAATIGAFVGAGYEMLLEGFSFSSVLFGVFGVGLTLGFAFMYSGLFFADISVVDFIFGKRNLFSRVGGEEKWGIFFFQASFAVTAFLFAYSLAEYTYFGISFSYIFVFVLTLFIAKRFGAIRAMAVGFISSVGISAAFSPAFALAGIGAGIFFNFGLGYGLVGAGILGVVWGGYVEGMTGFLSLFPEYMIAAIVAAPLIKKLRSERKEEGTEDETVQDKAREMTGAFWLSERKRINSVSSLQESLCCAADKIKSFSMTEGARDFEECRNIVIRAFSEIGWGACEENINIIATKVYKNQVITIENLPSDLEKEERKKILDRLSFLFAEYERTLYEKRRITALAEEYELLSKMINESLISESRESSVDENLTSAAREVFMRRGFPEGDIKVFGDSRKCVIGAGVDADGKLITSADLKRELEEELGLSLGDYEYFRKGDMALFKCSAVAAFKVSYAVLGEAASVSEESGDSTLVFECGSSFFSLISDGMGNGIAAKEGSEFVTGYIGEMLKCDAAALTAMSALNHIIRHKGNEYTATLDLFKLDLLRGEGVFIKSGAAPSYIKRDKSIYRIQSETAPLGVMRTLDAERIKVEVKSGDYVIMLSDGVSVTVEDSPWLLTYLSKEPPEDIKEYAKEILSLAKEKSKSRDDMSVAVMNIIAKQ